MTTEITDEAIAAKISYVREFQLALYEAAANVLPDNPIVAGLQVHAMYLPVEIGQAAWAGTDLQMPVEEALAFFIFLSAIAYADTQRRRPSRERFNKRNVNIEQNHVAMTNYAAGVLLGGREPDRATSARFTERYAELLRDSLPKGE